MPEEQKVEAVKIEEKPKEQPKQEAPPADKIRGPREIDPLENWTPKTTLGRAVFEGKMSTIEEVLNSGKKIIEPEIISKLVPEIKNELILIGGRGGKGGGAQRIPVRITAAMHKSGRRFHMGSLVVVGNEDGILGIGKGRAPETREAIRKAVERAKLNIMQIKRGCGSWECGCGTNHSVPYRTSGKSGSVFVELLPAPKGIGLVAENEAKKVLRLAGIKDVWVKTRGNTGMRINLINALYSALKNLYIYDKKEIKKEAQ